MTLMDTEGMFKATASENVVAGFCIIILDDQIAYAGPITVPALAAASSGGASVFINPSDFASLLAFVRSRQH